MKQSGQIVPLFAFSLVALALMAGLGVDGGYALFQQRQAQNAADLSSAAAVELLAQPCSGSGTAPTGSEVVADINTVIATSESTGSPVVTWTGEYLNSSAGALAPVNSAAPPSGACEIEVKVTSTWHTGLMALAFPTVTARVSAVSGYEASGSGRVLA